MSNVRKLYVLPSDYFDSLMQRVKVTADPLITAQIEVEKERSKIAKKRKSDDEKMADLSDILHRKNVLEEQMKTKKAEPVVVQIAPEAFESKKRGRPPKNKETFPTYEMSGRGLQRQRKNTVSAHPIERRRTEPGFISNFYQYEPKYLQKL